MPVLAVRDVDASVAYYRDRLGFGVGGIWDEPDAAGAGPTSVFAIVDLGSITIALQRVGSAEAGSLGRSAAFAWSAYLYISDVDAYHAQATRLGAEVLRAPEDQFYGCRDFDVRDPDGHVLAFGQDLNPSALGPGL